LSYPYYYVDASQNGTIKGSATLTVNVSTNQPWYIDTLPPWISTNITSGGAGQTTLTITSDPNESLISRNYNLEFYYGGDSPVYLNINQSPAQVWIEYSGNRYDFPISLSYSGTPPGGFWQLNGGPIAYSDSIYLEMRFTPGSTIDWEWENTYFPWFNVYDRTGTGDGYGPSFQATSSASGYYTVEGSAGGVEFGDYPLLINVGP
jgi:hypothetical protein